MSIDLSSSNGFFLALTGCGQACSVFGILCYLSGTRLAPGVWLDESPQWRERTYCLLWKAGAGELSALAFCMVCCGKGSSSSHNFCVSVSAGGEFCILLIFCLWRGREQQEYLGWDEKYKGEGREVAKAGNHQKDIEGFFLFFVWKLTWWSQKASLVSLCPHSLHIHIVPYVLPFLLLHCCILSFSCHIAQKRKVIFWKTFDPPNARGSKQSDEIRGISGKEGVKHWDKRVSHQARSNHERPSGSGLPNFFF